MTATFEGRMVWAASMAGEPPELLEYQHCAPPSIELFGAIAMTMEQRADSPWATDAGWVDEVLLAGPDDQVCFRLPEVIDRAGLRRLVAERRERLRAAGLRPGGAVALRLPPSIAYVANLLAVWQLGAQAI